MKTAICIFSFKGDAHALARAVEFVTRNLPGCPVFVFDDARAAIDHDDPALRFVDSYTRTTFERRGNLNGRECVMGMLASFLFAAQASGAERILKIDCDTAVLSRAILDCPGDLVGFGVTPKSIAGACYLLNSSLISKMLVEATRTAGLPLEESGAITKLARASGGTVALRTGDFAASFDYQRCQIPVSAYSGSMAVTFGRRDWMSASESTQRIVAAAAMGIFYEALYLGGKEHPCEAQDMAKVSGFLERPPCLAPCQIPR